MSMSMLTRLTPRGTANALRRAGAALPGAGGLLGRRGGAAPLPALMAAPYPALEGAANASAARNLAIAQWEFDHDELGGAGSVKISRIATSIDP